MKRAFRTLSSDSSKSPSGSPPAKRTAPKVGSRRPSAEAPKTPEASPSKKESLSIANVANIFIKMRRASDQVKTKPWHIDSSSGEAPQSHPGVLEAAMSDQRKALNHKATFICSGAVNVGHLLRLSRKQLVEIAEEIGANALVDERWDCTICGPKHRPNGTFKVDISYTASAVQCRIPDPHRPVALEKAKSVPGLMTIVRHTSND